MNWRFPLVAAAVVASALVAPSLFAQDAGKTPTSAGAPQAQPAPETTPPEAAKQEPENGKRANDQLVVIGYGIGQHLFATQHDTRQTTTQLSIISTLYEQYYGEWYLFDRFGVGLRYLALSERVTTSASVGIGGFYASYSDVVEVKVDTVLATAHWVPLGGRRYGRIGVLGGAGVTNYELSETQTPGGSETYSTSGTATLLGIYVDWGADGFGARFGTQYLSTDLGSTGGYAVDVSGRETYFDLRWAF